MNLNNVSRDDWIVGGLALLLVICLFALPWFEASVTFGAYSASATSSATGSPDGWLGLLAVLAALALVADLALERLSPQTAVPSIAGSRTNTRLILAGLVAVFVILKFLFHINFSGVVSFSWGFYVDVVITGALVYFSLQANAGRTPAFGPGAGGVRGPGAGPPPPTVPPTGSPGAGGTGTAPGTGSTPGSGGSSGTGGSTPPPAGP